MSIDWSGLTPNDMPHSERYARIALGLLMLAGGMFWQSGWGAFGVYPLVTGFSGNCPVYKMLGIR